MIRSGPFLWSLAMLAGAAPLAAQPPAERDWSAALREDAQALHDDIAANHPGPVNSKDPGFAKRNDAQLALALTRARDARTYGDYFYALAQYVASFDDGHMGFGAFGNTPADFRWPGFLTNYDAFDTVRVVFTADAAKVPVGAKLLGCDGMSAEKYAAATLGKTWGRWHLRSQRLANGLFLFLDEGNRYVPHARRCRFAVDGRKRDVAIEWRPIPVKEAWDRIRAMSPQVSRQFAARVLGDGTRWYAMPSFNADPQSAAGKALPPMIAAMRAERGALAAAPAIVLDLRGNGGGSSDWSSQIAEILWGRPAVRGLRGPKVHVDWRVSRANLDAMQETYARRAAGTTLSPDSRAWFQTVIKGLTAALERGAQLWRHPADEPERDEASASPPEPTPPPLRGPVYLLTDASCASACLDAVDLWRALGAVHVGQTTSADTLYMDVRRVKLPSGVTGVSMPMKVYRGRPRGANVPVVPTYLFSGDIADTAAVERWLATLNPGRATATRAADGGR
jgi:hypothetical protein